MTTRRHLLWALPLLLVLALITALLALPRFVASNAHRATIEALASSLTGREVHVGGALSLALLPAPQVVANDVTIGGPAGQVITARSLTLDMALPALLRGHLAARGITLQSPTITLPWPLPGGASAIVPPPWLTALHAQISDGTISLGRLRFSNVSADIFTAGDGALSVSGTGVTGQTPLTLSLGLAPPDADGRAALTVDSRTPDGKLGGHFSGRLQDNSVIGGQLTATFTLPGQSAPISGTADLTADATLLTASNIRLAQGGATLTGTARFNLAQPEFALDLAGDGLAAAPLVPLIAAGTAALPGTLALTATNLRLLAGTLPRLRSETSFGPEGVMLRRLTAALPGAGMLDLTGRIDAAGVLTADARLSTADLAALLAAFGMTTPLPATWRESRLHATLGGDRNALSLTGLSGSLGNSRLAGSLVLRRAAGGLSASGALHFDQLDLVPVIALLRQAGPASRFTLAGEITADHAAYGPLQLSRLLLDAALNDRLVIHRLSAALYGGVAVADFTLAPGGQLTAARALLAVPSAAPLLALAPGPPPPLPAVLVHAPLSLAIAAAGTPDDLATSAVATLGAFSVTAAPVINLGQRTAAGPLTLRHPDAIAALAPFGVNAGLAWPGAGSIALRADMAVSPARFSLPDFVLSFGDLTANGRLAITADRHVTADIAADTLALPPPPAKFVIPWAPLMAARGQISLSADQVWLGGQPILGPSATAITLAPNAATLALTRAGIGNGTLSGGLAATMANNMPALALKLSLVKADAASLTLPIDFPYSVPAATLSGQAALTAGGYAPAAWAATLAGTASLTASNGQLAGFDLAALAKALNGKPQAGWQKSATTGASNFTSLALSGAIAHGTLALQTATLQGPDGTATATGTIDLPDHAVALNLSLSPVTTPPTALPLTTIGSWTAPKQILPAAP